MNTVEISDRPTSYGDARSIQEALRSGEFIPYFQPIVTLSTGQLAGFEILARWSHPLHGLVTPDKFIALAEEQGWINALTEQLLRQAFETADILPAPLTLSINISPIQLRDSALPRLIQDAATRAGFSLDRLIVEITEDALCQDIECARSVANELKAMGCTISLDDFGTGYSSLFHLQSLPFGEMKVDRSYVCSITEKPQSRMLVTGVVALGQGLGLRTVAEGIETQEQAEMMLWLRCDLGQGWYYGRPVPAEDLPFVIAMPRHALRISEDSAWRTHCALTIDEPPAERMAHIRAVYDGAPVGLALLDKDLRYVSVNHRLATMNGTSVEAHIGSKLADMLPDLFPTLVPHLRRALAGEYVTDVKVVCPTTGIVQLCSYQPARNEAGQIVALSVAVMDVTEWSRAERQLCLNAPTCRNRKVETVVPSLSCLTSGDHAKSIYPSLLRNSESGQRSVPIPATHP